MQKLGAIRVTLIGMAASALLATVKLIAGLFGHSYALVADAIESFADIAGSAVVWSGLTVSAKPPDEKHPYGHGKAESLASLTLGLMLIAAAVGIAAKAVHEIISPQLAPAPFTLWVLIGVIIVKEGLYRLSSHVGQAIDSTVVRADALHHRSDALTSAAAAVGITISLYAGPGYEAADDYAAVFASFIIAYNGLRFVRLSVAELMDERPSHEVLAAMKQAAESVDGVSAVEKVLARRSGTFLLADMHIEVDGGISVREGHELAHLVKDAVRQHNPRVADVLIHVEPFDAQVERSG